MIYPGSDLKFQITTTRPDFYLSEDDFTIVIKDRYGRVRQTIRKQDCFTDTDENYYFVVEGVKRGVFYAWFEGSYEDEDYSKEQRDFTDMQELYRVCCRGCKCSCKCKHDVQYTQVYTVSIDGADYLADCDGNYIYTGDGKRIQFTKVGEQYNPNNNNDMKIQMKMTGEEFLQKWEGRSPDGTINTVPELFDSMTGIDDDETVQEDVQQQIDENMQEKAAESTDIDEIFGNE